MKEIMYIRLLIAVSTALLSACGSMPPLDTHDNQEYTNHAIAIDGNGGLILPPQVAQQIVQREEKKEKGKSALTLVASGVGHVSPENDPDRIDTYVQNIFMNADKTLNDWPKGKVKKIFIFFHGGLNSLYDSTERVINIIKEYDDKNNNKYAELKSYYPIFVNWDSGFFESYGEHVWHIRQGEMTKWGPYTSPLYFAADVGRGMVRAPIDIIYSTARDVSTIPGIVNYVNNYRFNSNLMYQGLESTIYSSNISRGEDLPWGIQTSPKAIWNVVTWPFQMIFAPVIDGGGEPALKDMDRRTKVLFNNPYELDVDRDRKNVPKAIEGLPTAAMTAFGARLSKFNTEHPDVEITLIGHSLGVLIINKLIAMYPDIKYKNIVYMAGADSVSNSFASIMPYMKKHAKTKFFNLTLHPQNELEEINIYGFMPRGSLLAWIDDYFSSPQTFSDRTVGRWDNLTQAYGLIPNDVKDENTGEITFSIRNRIFIKAFDQNSQIRKHGDFTEAEFWDEKFWAPGPRGCKNDPWPIPPGYPQNCEKR